MSEKEQTQDQAPAPFRVGDKVRCVDVRGYQSAMGVERNVVYEVEEFKPPCELVLRGKGPSHLSRCFVPAVAFVDRDGDRWLVVDERVPDTHKDTWAEAKTSGEPNGYVARAGSGFIPSCHINGGRRRILAEWVEFPAPEAKAVTEAEPSSETITMSKTHHGWLQNRILDLENARRELALVVGVLDGTQHVLTGRSEGTDKALAVMERINDLESWKKTVDVLEKQDKAHYDAIRRVLDKLPTEIKFSNGNQLSDAIEALYDDWTSAKMRLRAADARVAELEAERTKAPVSIQYLLTVLEERQATCFMEHAMAKYGELNCDYHKWLAEIRERRAALDGSREGA